MNNRCSFCGSKIETPKTMITSRDTGHCICENCIKLCYEAIAPAGSKKDKHSINWITPLEIKKELDRYIIGQDDAKITIAIAVYNHYKRMNFGSKIKIDKSNILMIGPTGCGKTLIAKTIAEILDVPFTIADCTSLTEAGFVGDDVENVLYKLIQAADGDIEKAERGIVFLDEIDKLASKQMGEYITKDPSGEGVQQALLKLVEGTVSNMTMHAGGKYPFEPTKQINTENILFICSGAFQGLEKIINQRISTHTAIGFGGKVEKETKKTTGEAFKEVITEDMVKYGLIPELIGRIPVVVSLDDLDEETMVEILTKPKNSIVNQYKAMFAYDNVNLEFTDEALREIAKETISMKTGARGLRGIIEKALKEQMFLLPSEPDVIKCIVNKGKQVELVRGKRKQQVKNPGKRNATINFARV